MNGNAVNEILTNDAKQVIDYSGDQIRPNLTHFDLDIDASTLTLYFSETVNISSLNFSQITLQDSSTASTNYTLTNGFSLSENGPIIIVNITKEDLDLIKFDFNLATSPENAFITFPSNLITDVSGNEVIPITDGSAYRVANYTEDTTPPILEYFDLDMNTGTITFYFSETVNSDSLNVPAITIQAAEFVDDDDLDYYYTLTAANWTSLNSTMITLNITRDLSGEPDDLNEIKRFIPLATSAITPTCLIPVI